MKSLLAIATLFWAMAGIAVGAAALFSGVAENNQGEFRNATTGDWDLGYAALVFGAWALTVFIAGIAVTVAGVAIYRSVRRASRT